MTAAQALAEAARMLTSAGIDGAPRDARWLLAWALGVAQDRIGLIGGDTLDPATLATFREAVSARATRVPLSHITGRRAFYGRDFVVNGDVLDPRPETETLVAAALDRPFDTVLDLGAGSGAIILTLLAERPVANGVATDISPAALQVLLRNAAAFGVSPRLRAIRSDWFEAVEGRFDLIVSNPPYIAAFEIAGLAPEVRIHEPAIALTDGGDGLDAYRRIAARAPGFLAPGGTLLLEIGPTQAEPVGAILTAAGFAELFTIADLDGRDRVVRAVL